MPKLRLTQLAVDRVRPPAAGRTELFDAHLPGFGLRVSAGGHRSWFLFYRFGGRQRRHTIGTLAAVPRVEEARERAREVLRDVARGLDPAAEAVAKPAALTLAELGATFIERHAKPRNRTWRGTARLLERHVYPAWGERPATDIAKRDVRALLDQVAAKHPVGVNRVLAAIRKLFNWAVEQDLLPTAPTAGVKAPAKETARERVLTDAELAAVWRAADALGPAARAFVRLLILTGQRRDEVAGLRWADVDLDAAGGAVWTLPREATKADRTHEVPLSAAAVAILAGLPREGEYVLSTTGGRRPISGYSKVKARLDELAGVTGWRFHDLRRTAGTGLARLGVAVATISRVLNHTEGGVTKIYNRYGYLDEKRAALNRWAAHVEWLVAPAPDNVVALRA
jgi:integrase